MKQYNIDTTDLFKQVDDVFKEADKVFKQVEKVMEQAQTESDAVLNKRQKWEPYTSWVPRKIGKRWYWHSPIYRKYQFKDTAGFYIYGTEFDVLKDSK